MRDSQWCYVHAPELAEERQRNNSRGGRTGGRGRPGGGKELALLKNRLKRLADDVLEGRVNRADAAVVAQVLNAAIRALALERQIHETEEVEAQLASLEARAAGGRNW